MQLALRRTLIWAPTWALGWALGAMVFTWALGWGDAGDLMRFAAIGLLSGTLGGLLAGPALALIPDDTEAVDWSGPVIFVMVRMFWTHPSTALGGLQGVALGALIAWLLQRPQGALSPLRIGVVALVWGVAAVISQQTSLFFMNW